MLIIYLRAVGQNKLFKFQQIEIFPNVLQFPNDIKGKWHWEFRNENPITLELACGKGEYSTGLGALHPERNFIGIDIKGNRIYTGAKKALDEQLNNVRFMRARINHITEYFAQDEVEEIWIIFPDPFLRDGKAKNRLTHQNFLSRYQKILKPGGVVHLKTDSPELFSFTRETVKGLGLNILYDTTDIYSKPLDNPALEIKTFYERMHLAEGRLINYIAFQLGDREILPIPKKKKDELEGG